LRTRVTDSQSSIRQTGQKADKHNSGTVTDYEDGEVDDLLTDDLHAKSLPKETVDHASTSHGKNARVSISDPKNGA
jgi:hypothetical protein